MLCRRGGPRGRSMGGKIYGWSVTHFGGVVHAVHGVQHLPIIGSHSIRRLKATSDIAGYLTTFPK